MGRYLTPGNVFVVFAAALGLYWCSNNFLERSRPKLLGASGGELVGVAVGILIGSMAIRVYGTYGYANGAALATHNFQAKLTAIVELKTLHPELPLLFYPSDVFNREPLMSIARFLAVKLPKPEKPFLITIRETGADSPQEIRRIKLFRQMSLAGDEFFAKISDFSGSNGQCIAIVFSGTTQALRALAFIYEKNFRCAYVVHI
jgi:hypothetical protein